MKKAITTAGLIIVLILSLGLITYAEGGTSSTVASLRIENYPERTVYGAFEELDVSGLVLSATLSDGSIKRVSGEDIQVSYNQDACFRVGDGHVTLSYGGKSVKLPVTVNRVSYDLTALELNSVSTVYNGKFQSYTELLPKIVGLDGIPLQMSTVGGSINAGVYDISIDFYTDSKDYLTPESRVVRLTVEPATAEVVWKELSFTYDGKSKSPSASFIDVNGASVSLSVVGAATNAGQDYTAIASTSDPNYKLTNTKATFEIKKTDYDMSGVKWSADNFTYDGSKRSVTVSGLPSGVSVLGYSGDRACDAGKYTATATLSWDKSNYNTPATLTHSWEILPADYDLSGVRFDSASFVFDGKMHYPTVKGNMPIGADGIALEYSFSAGACHVSDGVVSVIISFKTSSKNYNVPSDRYSSVCITPLGIEIEWGDPKLTYNGEEQAPMAFSDKCVLTVSGAKTNAGKYTAKAEADNSDYYVINDTLEYIIEKAKNAWIVTPDDTECYEGREISLTGKSKFGQIIYTFYSDPEGKNRISAPIACGKYYAALSVSATENYDGLRSPIICFEIVPIAPVSFYATISATGLRAFNRLLPMDIVCSVINNDGSSDRVDPSFVKVIYENGDSFRKNDSTVTLKYDKFTLVLPVEIGYANYDLSGVEWRYTSPTYDGKPKTPLIYGLPGGITVVEYVGSGVIDAGNYTVYARVDYDRENYNEPSLPQCSFEIKKAEINAPLITAVYNGEAIVPVSDSPLYKVTSTKSYTNAGKYSITVSLTDTKNYVFAENSTSSASAIFEILPATLYVSVSDVRLHLFESLGDVDYKITAGSVYFGDRLSASAYIDGKKVFVRSENPNYIFDVDSGKFIRLPYPTLKGALIILLAVMGVVLLVFTVRALYINRKRIATAAAILKCRWHNRQFVAPEPKAERGIHLTHDEERISFDSLEKEIDYPIEDKEPVFEADEEPIIEEGEGDFDIIDMDVDAERADMLITDSLAKSLIKKEGDIIYTDGHSRAIINVDTISESFSSGDRVDVNSLKVRGLIDGEVSYIKVLARGKIDKPLTVYANDFSLSAVKMIALTGGQSVKAVTRPIREKD